MTKLDWSKASLWRKLYRRAEPEIPTFTFDKEPPERKRLAEGSGGKRVAKAKVGLGRRASAPSPEVRAADKGATLPKISRAQRRAAQRANEAQAKAEREGRRQRTAEEPKAAKLRKAEAKKAREAEATARRLAVAEYRKSPEFAAKLERERAAMEAKKKSHLQAWAEDRGIVGTDRTSLRARWRAMLVRRGPAVPDENSDD